MGELLRTGLVGVRIELVEVRTGFVGEQTATLVEVRIGSSGVGTAVVVGFAVVVEAAVGIVGRAEELVVG